MQKLRMPLGMALSVMLVGWSLPACFFFNAGNEDLVGREDASAVPEEFKQRENPIAASPESIETGRRIFASGCVACHGPDGDGQGELAEHLELAPPDFTRPGKRTARKTDGELFYILTEGHEAMPGQGDRWNDEMKWHIVNYIRSLDRRKH